MSESHPHGQITTERRGHLYLVGMDRTKKLNGMTPKMYQELTEAYAEIEANDEIWAGVLFAHGDHFTAGLDLPMFHESMKKGERAFAPEGGVDVYGLKSRMTKPMICAVQGITYTAGIELMLACDIVVAASDCRFAQLEPLRGVMAAGGATIRFVQRCGWGNAMYHLLTSDEFGADEAYRVGLVQEIVEPGKQLDRAVELATLVTNGAPLAIQATKANSMDYILNGEEAAIGEFTPIQTRLANTRDAAEGVAAFVERRAPNFEGA